jgi:hypothetical protein
MTYARPGGGPALADRSVVETTNDDQAGEAMMSSLNRICLAGAVLFAVAAALMVGG